jgi:2-iminobutanoate/2-iminopropanoate deaminase
MKLVVHDPTAGIYPTSSDYVHAVEVQEPRRFLYISGTMGLDERRAVGASLTEQLHLIWANIRTILASAGMTVDHIVRLTSYLGDVSYADENAAARAKALGGRAIATTAIVAGLLSPDWLVEIEVIAAA